MASVYLARVRADAGFSRLYAIKVLHPHLSREPELVDMLLDEARIAARLHHPNVVSTVDVGHDEGGRTYLVMDYVDGPALDRLLRRMPDERPPARIVPVVIDALRGLHAAHELRDESGAPLELVHRDATPGNVLVGVDGVGRITDFGVAKARARVTKTREGIVKGKAGYIAPEVLVGGTIDRRADVFSMGVLLWNALTGETLFETDDLASTLRALLEREVPPPSTVGHMPPAIFDAPILMALARDPNHRHESALEMAHALSDALAMAGGAEPPEAIGAWVQETFGTQLETRRKAARTPSSEPTWDPDQLEPPSTSAMVRKDPTGRVVSAMPAPAAEGDSQHDALRPGPAVPTEKPSEEPFEEPRPVVRTGETAPAPKPERASGRARGLVIGLVVLLAAAAGVAAYFLTRPATEAAETSTPSADPPAASEASGSSEDSAERAPTPDVDLSHDLHWRDEGDAPAGQTSPPSSSSTR